MRQGVAGNSWNQVRKGMVGDGGQMCGGEGGGKDRGWRMISGDTREQLLSMEVGKLNQEG